MDLDLSHFGLLIFGLMLGWPHNRPIDASDYVAWALVGFIFVAIALLWQRANDWPGASSRFALAMMLYGAMFILGILFSIIAVVGYQSFKKLYSRS